LLVDGADRLAERPGPWKIICWPDSQMFFKPTGIEALVRKQPPFSYFCQLQQYYANHQPIV